MITFHLNYIQSNKLMEPHRFFFHEIATGKHKQEFLDTVGWDDEKDKKYKWVPLSYDNYQFAAVHRQVTALIQCQIQRIKTLSMHHKHYPDWQSWVFKLTAHC